MTILTLWVMLGVTIWFMRVMMWPESTTTFEERMAKAKWYEL